MNLETLREYKNNKLKILLKSERVYTGFVKQLNATSFLFNDKFEHIHLIAYEDVKDIIVLSQGDAQ